MTVDETIQRLSFPFSYFARGKALALSQRVIGLYILALRPSAIKLNSFARHAVSQLTSRFNLELYEDFVNAWGTHVITASLIGGMIEEKAIISRCFRAKSLDAFGQCLPFSSRRQAGPECSYYASQARVVSKHRLGGSVQAQDDNEWKRTLAEGPALLQILAMKPWYELVDDKAIKGNLRSIIQYRLKVINTRQAETVRYVDAHLSRCPPCSGTSIILNLISLHMNFFEC